MAAVATFLALVGSACALRQPSISVQSESFEAFESLSVGSVPIRRFALLRSAFLVYGDELEPPELESRSSSDDGTSLAVGLRFRSGDGDISLGSAAAVDRRGYLLTAAHCVEVPGSDGGIFLLFPVSASRFVIEPARLVWSGQTESRSGPDLALLHVDRALPYVFEWGELPDAGSPLISVGVGGQSNQVMNLSFEPIGGRFIEVQDLGDRAEGMTSVLHDSPLREGNSGGPLVDPSGRLIGVNHARWFSLDMLFARGHYRAIAVRPDPDWLSGLIERDQFERKTEARSKG